MKISNRKDSGREDASEDCPDESATSGSGVASSLTPAAEVNKSPTSSHQDVLSAAKEGASPKSPEPTSAANTTPASVVIPTAAVAAATTSQVPSASSPAVASKTSSAKSHSSQSASMAASS